MDCEQASAGAPERDSRESAEQSTTGTHTIAPPAHTSEGGEGENSAIRLRSANGVFSNWEDQYKPESQTSWAEFFHPTELTSQSASTARAVLCIDDFAEPTNPSVPRIILTEPEDHVTTAGSSKSIRTTQVAARDDLKTHFQSEERIAIKHERSALERRYSSVMPESWDGSHNTWGAPTRELPEVSSRPHNWTATTTSRKRGWTMKTRRSFNRKRLPSVDIVMVYMYNSALCDEDQDEDADLNPFRCRVSTPIDVTDTELPKKIRRARTDITKQQNETSSIFQLSKEHQMQRSKHKKGFKHTFVNWLHDEKMLEQQMDGSRISTIGFDLSPKSSAPDDLESAAEQLNEYLHVLRHEHQPPILFLGHSYGSLIVISSLSFASAPTSRFKNILKNAAGLFIFSYPDFDQAPKQDMAADQKFEDINIENVETLHDSSLKISGQTVNSKLFSVVDKEHVALQDTSPESYTHYKSQGIAIGLPVFYSITSYQQRTSDSRFHKLLGAPPQVVVMGKVDKDLARFADSDDTDFQRLILSLKNALNTRQLLVAAAMADLSEIRSMLRKSTDLNLADRWGQTALHIAIRLDHEVIVHSLLGQPGIDVNARDLRSNTALHHAVRKGNEAIVTTLLHHGADVEMKNTRKRTARDIAESLKSRRPIAKMLRSQLVSGPETNVVAKRFGDGRLPVSEQGKMACMNAQITITEILESGRSDKYWSVNVSVASLLYGKTGIDDILQQVRPRKVQGKRPLCTWIHIPENNLIWVEDLFERLHHLDHSVWESTRPWITSSLRNRAITPHAKSDQITSAFLPYLSYEARHLQTKRAEYIRSNHAQHLQKEGLSSLPPNSFPIVAVGKLQIPQAPDLDLHPYRDDSESDNFDDTNPSDSDDMEEEEKASISTYLNGPPALHTRRTLDQFYYHMLENTTDRDQSQVISRWSQRDDPVARHNILMVDQIWLWSFSIDQSGPRRDLNVDFRLYEEDEEKWLKSSHYVVTSFPDRVGAGHTPHRKHDDLRLQVLEPSGRKRGPIRRPVDLVARILETCCGIFDRLHDVEELRFFSIFESSIGALDDKESRLFRTFQTESTQLLDLDAMNKFYQERKNTLLRNMLDIRKEIEFLVEVKDIRDEINIILSVLQIQQTVIAQMKAIGTPYMLRAKVTAQSLVETDIADFRKLDEEAKSIQEKLETLMDLKQKAANAWEAREARETAVAASKQGNIVLVFTVVTIIFLPLSFMSAFFTIGISAFPKDKVSGETSWPMGLVTAILFGVSLSVSLPLIAFALNMDLCSAMFNELRYNYCAHACIKLINLLPNPASHRRLSSRRRDWLERLTKSREQYLRVEVDHIVADDTEGRAKRMASAMLKASMPAGTRVSRRISSANDANTPLHVSDVLQKLRRRGKKVDEECLFPGA